MKFCIYMATVCMASVLLAEDATNSVATSATDPAPVATNATVSAATSATTTEAEANEDEPAEKPTAGSGFERFKTIMDRNPFGRPPPGFDPDAPGGASDIRPGAEGGAEAAAAAEASAVEQQIISSVRVSVLNVTPSGKINVGFTDSSAQPPRNYLMEVGEKREGCEWQVVEADPEKLLVKVSKDGVEATLKLGGGSADSDVKKDGDEVAKNAAGAGPVPGMGLRPGMPPPGLRRPPLPGAAAGAALGAAGVAGEGMTGLDIARARRQERLKQQQDEAEQRRQAAEQAKQEREQERRERELAAEERKAQLAQLVQIQEELRRQREEKQQAEAERRAAEAAQQQVDPQQDVN